MNVHQEPECRDAIVKKKTMKFSLCYNNHVCDASTEKYSCP
jgi:hypothetical protein